MGKQQKKTAKGRLDKFYWLAKEQGYRSRAAFKLVQLNKKYNFLEKARCCIDLCAAPGGWLQVASKFMPANSLIVGVDLVPIKPIPRTITFAEDINSYKCRDQLRQILKDWKADIVIHDGAPNVGTAWVQDAYAQSELTLQSLRLAAEFLNAGGTFVTKVFRSKDYNNLLWVFNQLFKKVEATKPSSSRNVSAEIFVVCQGYKNPARIDPKFLDPQHVFKELDPTALVGADQEAGIPFSLKGTSAGNAHANVFEPKKVRKHREGYADGDYTLFHSLDAMDFIKGQDVIGMLGSYNEISFKTQESKNLLDLPDTTQEMRENCKDLKVLGKKDFRNLMNWRKEVRLALNLDQPKSKRPKDLAEQTETVEIEEMDEDDQIDDELARLNEEAARKARKERRRKNELRQKKILKMQLQMTTPMDIGMDVMDDQLGSGNGDIFEIGPGEKVSKKALQQHADLIDDDSETIVSSHGTDDDDPEERTRRLDAEMDALYDEYKQKQSERDAKFRATEARFKDAKNDSWHGIKGNDDDEDRDDDESDGSDESEGGYHVVQRRKEQEETFDTDDEEDEEDERLEREAVHQSKKRKRDIANVASGFAGGDDTVATLKPAKRSLVNSLVSDAAITAEQSREASIWFDNPLFKDLELNAQVPDEDRDDEEQDDAEDWEDAEADSNGDDASVSGTEEGEEEDDFEVVPQDQEDDAIPDDEWNLDGEDEEARKQKHIKDHGLATAEAVALAQALVNRQITKEDLMDQGFSKHNFVDKDGLPTWFLDDETKHYKANIPITKEAVQALRERQRALDARPIKKVAEAKARKKMRTLRRLEKAQKKAETINENEDITEREKSNTINKLLAKSVKGGQKKKEVQLVVAKGVNRGLKGRPKGTKGRYKMVDPRMKKELRAFKRKAKRDGKKLGSSNSKPRVAKGYGPRN
ncbi:probable AdoMet-dependent rRNA methyltransferase SPB1 [Melanopsichium pennsylvanicum]|uniref:Probable AdoMet-dependent rRNA methyltransferase SPB1 n=2 Tax=Melanopsichium pennsylvanicum TaxID=63383 RepID=A0AAJ4XQL7_9BASI|nr:probable SPB1-required for ribosome synthesis, putative methylase [Melanopsichium pennsylvanicum 4]SNX86126.1 probable AdoMet-dependent rRNA methyltransferase SPB1 [Melanopsichium pennsylvanicum]